VPAQVLGELARLDQQRQRLVLEAVELRPVAGVAEGDDAIGEVTHGTGYVQVVAVEQGTGILLGTAVWHAIPFSPTAPTTCLVVFRRGTSADDLEVVPLPMTVRVAADGLDEHGTNPNG
jgi:hypothetical protein